MSALTAVCSARFQEGLLGGVHHLPDPVHRAAHAAVGRPRREASGLHCACPGKVGHYGGSSWSVNSPTRQNVFVTARSALGMPSRSFADVQTGKMLSHPTHTAPAQVKQGNTLPPSFSFHTVNKYPFHGLCMPWFSHFCAFVLVISPFMTAPKPSAEVRPDGPASENPVTGHRSDRLSGASVLSAVATSSMLTN